MDLKKAAGRLLMVGIPGECADSSFLKEISQWGVGGIIFFSRHLVCPERVKDDMKAIIDACGYEPLFAIDHEGGPVMRFDRGMSELPSAMALVAAGGGTIIRDASCLAARELAQMGFNTNLAPVCDINEVHNPGIGIRSFGEEPDVVADSVAMAVEGFSQGGLLSTAKHFPGKGAALVDAHVSMPVVTLTRERILAREIIPFRRALDAGATLLMTSHILFSELDSSNAATFSRKIVEDLVRNELGFEGIVISDDLEMGGAREEAEPAKAALLCINGGHDMAMICHTFDAQCRARRLLLDSMEKGILPVDSVHLKIERIKNVLKHLKVLRENPGTQSFSRDDVDRIAEKAIVRIDSSDFIPLKKCSDRKIVLYLPDLSLSTPSADDRSGVLGLVEDSFRKNLPHIEVRRFALDGSPQNSWSVSCDKNGGLRELQESVSVVLSNNAHLSSGQTEMIEKIYEESSQMIHVALRNPYDLGIIKDPHIVKIATLGFRYNVLEALVKILLQGSKCCGAKVFSLSD